MEVSTNEILATTEKFAKLPAELVLVVVPFSQVSCISFSFQLLQTGTGQYVAQF